MEILPFVCVFRLLSQLEIKVGTIISVIIILVWTNSESAQYYGKIMTISTRKVASENKAKWPKYPNLTNRKSKSDAFFK